MLYREKSMFVSTLLALVLLLVLAMPAAALENDQVFDIDNVKLVDCPIMISKDFPSNTVFQIIDNTFHRWREYKIGSNGEIAIFMEKPEKGSLTVEEARELLIASQSWMYETRTLDISEDEVVDPEGLPTLKGMPTGRTINRPDDYEGIVSEEGYIEYTKPEHLFNKDNSKSKDQKLRSSAEIEIQFVRDPDNRERVSYSQCITYPWNTIGYLENQHFNRRGTAFLIGPHTALTNAHNLYNSSAGGWFNYLIFYPGQYQAYQGASITIPYGFRYSYYGGIPQGYATYEGNLTLTNPYDFGAFYIEEPFAGISTFMPIVFDVVPSYIYLAGYPGEVKGETYSLAMWFSGGLVYQVLERELYHWASSSPGTSGAPIWDISPTTGTTRIVGVTAQGAPLYNTGPRFASHNKALIETWMQWQPKEDLSSDANLKALSVDSGVLTPSFNPNTTNYTVNLPSNITTISITATLADDNASVTINGEETGSGVSKAVNLGAAGSETLINITVIAEDGITNKDYTITVIREESLADDADLSALIISPGDLVPAFNSGISSYSFNVGHDVKSVNVIAVLSDSNASLSINGLPVNSGESREIILGSAGTVTTINIFVTAEDGDTIKTYSIIVYRDEALSDVASLSGLTVTPGTLVPAFNPDISSYAVNVEHDVETVNVIASLDDDNATLTIKGQAAASGEAKTITLGDPGKPTEINIVVTAEDGETNKAYMITVNRKKEPAGDDANLSDLAVSEGTLTPVFEPNITSYSLDIAHDISTILITATLSDSNASMEINGEAVNISEAKDITLGSAGTETVIDIIVTAEDGETTKTYTVIVTREKEEDDDPKDDPDTYNFGLYDPIDGNFHLRNAEPIRFGPRNSEWLPVRGNWNVDGTFTFGLYDPEQGNFWLYHGPDDIEHIRFGDRNSTRIPLAGDWNGDGSYGIGLYDHSEGKFYLRLGSGEHIEDRHGSRGNDWIPVAGDWNGDGVHTVALYDPDDGNFHPYGQSAIRFGPKGENWTPVTGDWNGDGVYGVGLHHDGHFHLDTGKQERYGPLGDTKWIPVTGKW